MSHPGVIFALTLWYNSYIKLSFKKNWYKTGIRDLSDTMHSIGIPLLLNEILSSCDININILEHGEINVKSKMF